MWRVQISKEFGGVRRSLVAVAAAFHHQPQIVRSGEIDRCGDILRRLGGDRVDARPGRPGADPAKRLRQPDLVAEIVGIFKRLEEPRASGVRRRVDTGGKRRAHLDEPPADIAAELLPACLRRPAGITRTNAGRGRCGPAGAIADRHAARAKGRVAMICKRRLLFIGIPPMGAIAPPSGRRDGAILIRRHPPGHCRASGFSRGRSRAGSGLFWRRPQVGASKASQGLHHYVHSSRQEISQSTPTIEGAGVKLRRAFGFGDPDPNSIRS